MNANQENNQKYSNTSGMYVKSEILVLIFPTPLKKSTLKGISVLKNVGLKRLSKYIVF